VADFGAELVEDFNGFGVGFNFFEESLEADFDGVFVDLADTGPGVGEAGDVVGVVLAFAGLRERLEDERADEEVAAEMGGGAILRGGVVGELFDVFEHEVGFIAVGLFFAPARVVGVVPTGECDTEIADDDVVVGGGAGPAEGIGVAGFEFERGDVAVGGLGEEPGADLFVLRAVVELAVDLFADGLGHESEARPALSHRIPWVCRVVGLP